MTAEFDAKIEAISDWIGRKRIVDDEIALSKVQQIAGMLDQDPDGYQVGSSLPSHWFSMFFPNAVRQSDIGPDGHPNKGVILPPIPLPRRMGAGRRVSILSRSRMAGANGPASLTSACLMTLLAGRQRLRGRGGS